ncbi:MAG: hypothetical protein M3014_15380, partial [Chloroflexota bacterium]|nr:hypothetical protein [Chloroflexota bacterium]
WNLVHGNGLVYNPGEVVEGYTNFLWTMLAAGGLKIGWYPAGLMLAGTIVCSQALMGMTFFIGRKLAGNSAWALVTAAVLATDVALVTYGGRGSGIEAVPFAALCMLPVVLIYGPEKVSTRWRVAAGAALALASLIRPEGVLIAALLLVVTWWQDRAGGRRPALKLLSAALLPYLAVVVPYQVWRISFYKWPFPNTFYAKTGLSIEIIGRGLDYVRQFAAEHWLPAALTLVGGMLAITHATILQRKGELLRRPTLAGGSTSTNSATVSQAGAAVDSRASETGGDVTSRRPFAPGRDVASRRTSEAGENHRSRTSETRVGLALFVAVFTLYIVSIGGDWFPSQRFFVPLLAPLALLAQEAARIALGRTPPRLHSIARGGLTVVLLAYTGYSLWLQRPEGDLADRTNRHSTYIDRWGTAGVWLRDNTPPGTWTAARAAGAMAYYSQRPVLDMYGLNDLHIGHLNVPGMGSNVAGHEKQDAAYVLGRKPTYVLASWEDYFDPVAAELKKRYSYRVVRSPTGPEVKWLKLTTQATP